MTKGRTRKTMIRERMRRTGEPFMIASRGIGEWRAANQEIEVHVVTDEDPGGVEGKTISLEENESEL